METEMPTEVLMQSDSTNHVHRDISADIMEKATLDTIIHEKITDEFTNDGDQIILNEYADEANTNIENQAASKSDLFVRPDACVSHKTDDIEVLVDENINSLDTTILDAQQASDVSAVSNRVTLSVSEKSSIEDQLELKDSDFGTEDPDKVSEPSDNSSLNSLPVENSCETSHKKLVKYPVEKIGSREEAFGDIRRSNSVFPNGDDTTKEVATDSTFSDSQANRSSPKIHDGRRDMNPDTITDKISSNEINKSKTSDGIVSEGDFSKNKSQADPAFFNNSTISVVEAADEPEKMEINETSQIKQIMSNVHKSTVAVDDQADTALLNKSEDELFQAKIQHTATHDQEMEVDVESSFNAMEAKLNVDPNETQLKECLSMDVVEGGIEQNNTDDTAMDVNDESPVDEVESEGNVTTGTRRHETEIQMSVYDTPVVSETNNDNGIINIRNLSTDKTMMTDIVRDTKKVSDDNEKSPSGVQLALRVESVLEKFSASTELEEPLMENLARKKSEKLDLANLEEFSPVKETTKKQTSPDITDIQMKPEMSELQESMTEMANESQTVVPTDVGSQSLTCSADVENKKTSESTAVKAELLSDKIDNSASNAKSLLVSSKTNAVIQRTFTDNVITSSATEGMYKIMQRLHFKNLKLRSETKLFSILVFSSTKDLIEQFILPISTHSVQYSICHVSLRPSVSFRLTL